MSSCLPGTTWLFVYQSVCWILCIVLCFVRLSAMLSSSGTLRAPTHEHRPIAKRSAAYKARKRAQKHTNTYFWLLSPQMAVARTDSTDITGGNSCSPKTEYISIMQTINTNHAPQIMCNCGRPSEHSLKRGLLFSNVLILREITLFLGFKDLVAFKDAF